jgi:hypothetical protein
MTTYEITASKSGVDYWDVMMLVYRMFDIPKYWSCIPTKSIRCDLSYSDAVVFYLDSDDFPDAENRVRQIVGQLEYWGMDVQLKTKESYSKYE